MMMRKTTSCRITRVAHPSLVKMAPGRLLGMISATFVLLELFTLFVELRGGQSRVTV
jgi:hypothetical protein